MDTTSLSWWHFTHYFNSHKLNIGKVMLYAFSEKLKWNLPSHVWLFATPWTIQSMEFSRPESWSGSLSLLWGIFPTQDLPNLPTLQADSLPAEPQGKGLCQILQLVSDSVGIWTWLLCPESLWFYSTKFHCWSYSTASLKRSLTNSWLISVPLGVLFYFKFWFFFSVFSDVAMVGKTKLSTVV